MHGTRQSRATTSRGVVLSDLKPEAVSDISNALATLLADVFTLYLKTKNFHWHMTGHQFRDYHLLLDDQGAELFDITDNIAERARKIGGTTLRSIGQIASRTRLLDNDSDSLSAHAMLSELRDDNLQLVSFMRETHDLTSDHNDVATTSLLEEWIGQAEGRIWFLSEITSGA